jgi:hypothetical protein
MAETASKPMPVVAKKPSPAQANNPLPVEEDQFQEETRWERFTDWVRTELVWYAGSFSFHLLALSVLLLLPNFSHQDNQGDAPVLESKAEDVDKTPERPLDPVDIGDIEPDPPAVLDVDPTLEKPGQEAQEAEYNDDSKVFEHKGGGSATGVKDMEFSGGVGALAFGPGPKVTGDVGLGMGVGTRKEYGSGGSGSGFGGRGTGNRQKMLATGGGTKHTERAVTAALVWLAKHQDPDGHWGLDDYTKQCTDRTCTGQGDVSATPGGTAMGLLPFLAAGQTHRSKGPYTETIRKGLVWLISHQQPDGDLAKGAHQPMYSHGLATITLCEAYGLTGDKDVGRAAQLAVNFILAAQNAADGGWRYYPKDPGDTSVVGWQLMALKSAHMAGLDVGGSVFSGTSKWLDSVAVDNGTQYSYQPSQGSSPTMTSVGLLCRQYLGAKRDNPMLTGGTTYLMNRVPQEGDNPNIYYWYYATQVLHNMSGAEWDTWNRKMRDVLVHTQVRNVDECANGSWPPERDPWGRQGGRVMQTSLSALTLEIYYRYLPLFKAEAAGDNGGGEAAAATASAATQAEAADAKPAKVADAKAPKSTKGSNKKAAAKKAKGDASDTSGSS